MLSMSSFRDVSIDSHVNPHVVHLTHWKKTDVFSIKVELHLGCTNSLLCPVTSLLAYMAIRPSIPGPLFLFADGNPLSPEDLMHQIHQALSATGLDVSGYTGHSFCMGAASTAALDGLPDSTIKMLGQWKSDAFTRTSLACTFPCGPL